MSRHYNVVTIVEHIFLFNVLFVKLETVPSIDHIDTVLNKSLYSLAGQKTICRNYYYAEE